MSQSPAAAWQYGMGKWDAESKRITSFEPLRHFSGIEWQPRQERPDEELGWISLDALGGHCGNDADHLAIRRWTAPESGTLTISGRLWHQHEVRDGDGVRADLTSSQSGPLGEWTAFYSETKTEVGSVAVKAGDILDFAVDRGMDAICDVFEWTVELRLADGKGKITGVWNSAADFAAGSKSAETVWSYGMGRFDEGKKRIADFTPLAHWSGTQWQVGKECPDEKLRLDLSRCGWRESRRTGSEWSCPPLDSAPSRKAFHLR